MGGSSFETNLINFEVCDPNAMRKVNDSSSIERIYGLNSKSDKLPSSQIIRAAVHQKLLFMDSCSSSCPLTKYKLKFEDKKLSKQIKLNKFNDIIVKTNQPLRENLYLVGFMSKDEKPECSSVVKENKIPIQIEVCGNEKVKLVDQKDLQYDFVVGREPKQVELDRKLIQGLF